MSEPKRSIAITDHFTCTYANVIHCIHCPYCKKLYIGETGRRLGDRFREHLRDVERNDKDISELVARHFISLIILGSIWQFAAFPCARQYGKPQNSKTKLQIGTLNPNGNNERFTFN